MVYEIDENEVLFELTDEWKDKKGNVTYYLVVLGEGGSGYTSEAKEFAVQCSSTSADIRYPGCPRSTDSSEPDEEECGIAETITYYLDPNGALPVLEIPQFEARSLVCLIDRYELFETREDTDDTDLTEDSEAENTPH